jgi:hypothetical protein
MLFLEVFLSVFYHKTMPETLLQLKHSSLLLSIKVNVFMIKACTLIRQFVERTFPLICFVLPD